MRLTLDQEEGLSHLLEKRENIFLTGGAGTGKTFLVREFLKKKLDEKIPVLASTGTAAILTGGRTFHSYFGLGIMRGGAEGTFERAAADKRLRSRLRKATSIIVDEVSMLSWEVLDCAERLARHHRSSADAWGGIRVIAVGDFAQLPPVGRILSTSASSLLEPEVTRMSMPSHKLWGFLGEAWARSDFRTIHLREVKRTEDKAYLKVLEDVRWGNWSIELQRFLEVRENLVSEDDAIRVFPRRLQTEAYNSERLENLPGKLRCFESVYGGAPNFISVLKREAPIPEKLQLKRGARVMIRINDPKMRFVNGTQGRILELRDEALVIGVGDRIVELEPFVFSIHDADGREVAYAKNFPVTLAYASTIHKVQGATLEKIAVDLSRLWEPGQAYVALSRARRADDVTVLRWSRNSFKSDDLVKEFYGNANESFLQKSEPLS